MSDQTGDVRYGQGMDGLAALYVATTLDSFIEPFDPQLGRCALAATMQQEGVTYRRVDADYYHVLEAMVMRAERANLSASVLAIIHQRWREIVAMWGAIQANHPHRGST